MAMLWKRPAQHAPRFDRVPCNECPALTSTEYAITQQSEPGELTVWTPWCVDHAPHQCEDCGNH